MFHVKSVIELELETLILTLFTLSFHDRNSGKSRLPAKTANATQIWV